MFFRRAKEKRLKKDTGHLSKGLWTNNNSNNSTNPLTPITDTMPSNSSSANLFMNNENSNTCSSWLDDQILTEDEDMLDDDSLNLSPSTQY